MAHMGFQKCKAFLTIEIDAEHFLWDPSSPILSIMGIYPSANPTWYIKLRVWEPEALKLEGLGTWSLETWGFGNLKPWNLRVWEPEALKLEGLGTWSLETWGFGNLKPWNLRVWEPEALKLEGLGTWSLETSKGTGWDFPDWENDRPRVSRGFPFEKKHQVVFKWYYTPEI